MNIISAREALQLLNERLQKPVTRQLFHQSIAPVLLKSGYATRAGNVTVIDADAWQWWVGYIAFRERKITAGDWHTSRPYSAEEAEAWRDGGFDDDPLATA